jgi:hypothetical protein
MPHVSQISFLVLRRTTAPPPPPPLGLRHVRLEGKPSLVSMSASHPRGAGCRDAGCNRSRQLCVHMTAWPHIATQHERMQGRCKIRSLRRLKAPAAPSGGKRGEGVHPLNSVRTLNTRACKGDSDMQRMQPGNQSDSELQEPVGEVSGGLGSSAMGVLAAARPGGG